MYDDHLFETINKRKAFLEQVITSRKASLEHAPEGHLRFQTRGRNVCYFHRTDPKDVSGVYIKKSDRSLAAALAQKDYDSKVLYRAQNELKHLDMISRNIKLEKIETIYDNMPPQRRILVQPAALSDSTYAERWQAAPFEGKAVNENTPEFYTGKGERVRSKSEILIADTLARYQIPYRYECPIKTRQLGTIYPDFTALNVRKRTVFIWEHLGMMDDPEYIERALSRIEVLELNGYFPGKNLIITHETSDSPIRTKLIIKMIENFLL